MDCGKNSSSESMPALSSWTRTKKCFEQKQKLERQSVRFPIVPSANPWGQDVLKGPVPFVCTCSSSFCLCLIPSVIPFPFRLLPRCSCFPPFSFRVPSVVLRFLPFSFRFLCFSSVFLQFSSACRPFSFRVLLLFFRFPSVFFRFPSAFFRPKLVCTDGTFIG